MMNNKKPKEILIPILHFGNFNFLRIYIHVLQRTYILFCQQSTVLLYNILEMSMFVHNVHTSKLL